MSADDSVTDNTGKTATGRIQEKPRGWFRRNFRRIVLLLLTIVVVGAGAVYWSLYLRVYNLKVCQDAMKTIAADKGMQESLGQPIKNVLRPSQESMPSARVEAEEIDVHWSIVGSKGQAARAHLVARQRQGRWDIITLKVKPAGSKDEISIQQAGDAENDAPPSPFGNANSQPPKTEVKKPDTKGPDINIDVSDPTGEAPAEEKK
jgi:hypothetical protein